MLLIADLAFDIIFAPHEMRFDRMFDRNDAICPGSWDTVVAMPVTKFTIAVIAFVSMSAPHWMTAVSTCVKISSAFPGSSIRPLTTPSTMYCPCSCMTVDGDAIPNRLLNASSSAVPIATMP